MSDNSHTIIILIMDRRRVNGPEQSVPPLLKNLPERQPILNNDGKRVDQRKIDDLRPICK